jgi:hypothetical protein
MESHKPKDHGKEKRSHSHIPERTKKKLDKFLSSLCKAGGMTNSAPPQKRKGADSYFGCQGRCRQGDWRAHMDIPAGILCVSAKRSSDKRAEPHWDVALAITYTDSHGKPGYIDMVFCDSEVRWLMETLWHAPLWE